VGAASVGRVAGLCRRHAGGADGSDGIVDFDRPDRRSQTREDEDVLKKVVLMLVLGMLVLGTFGCGQREVVDEQTGTVVPPEILVIERKIADGEPLTRREEDEYEGYLMDLQRQGVRP
jgi:hypothetical protein